MADAEGALVGVGRDDSFRVAEFAERATELKALEHPATATATESDRFYCTAGLLV